MRWSFLKWLEINNWVILNINSMKCMCLRLFNNLYSTQLCSITTCGMLILCGYGWTTCGINICLWYNKCKLKSWSVHSLLFPWICYNSSQWTFCLYMYHSQGTSKSLLWLFNLHTVIFFSHSLQRYLFIVPYRFHRRGLMVCALWVCLSVCLSVTLFWILQ